MEREYIYDAFISYRHTKLDKAVANKLQKQLERYVPPSSAMNGKTVKKLRIFRDETELPTSSNLSDDIRTALDKSRFLIVICSKTTAQSKWCMQEITYFKELHGGKTDKIITLLTEGEPSEVFPPELCTEIRTISNADGTTHTETIDVEPLAANVSASTERESLRKLNREFLRIAAPLFNCGYDTLYNRNQKRFIQRVATISASLIIFLVAFAIYSSIMIVQISTQRNELELRNRDLLIQESRYLSKESAEFLDADDRIGAINAALAALPAEDRERPWTPQAEYALSQALYAYQNGGIRVDRHLTHHSPVEQVMYSRDGTRVVSSDRQNNLYIWNPATGESVGFFSANADFFVWGMAINTNNRLYVSTGHIFICIDANSTEIIWENEYKEYRPGTHGSFSSAFMSENSVVLSNDEKTLALVGSDGVLFVNAADGEMLFYQKFLDDDNSFGESLDTNGTFSTDDNMFYISSSDSFSMFGDNEPNAGKAFGINIETGEVIIREFDKGSQVLGIFADEEIEIFAVSNYGGDGRDVLLAFAREVQEPVWTYILSTNAGFRSRAFVYRYDTMVLIACGSATVVINANNGERIIADTLSANILHCMALPGIPNRVIAVLENGEICLTMLKEDNFSPMFGIWSSIGRYRKDLSAVSFTYDPTDEEKSISDSMRYAFVPKHPRLHMAQPYFPIAIYIEDSNYLSVANDGLAYHLDFSENGDFIAWTSSNTHEDYILYIADSQTGEIVYERNIGVGIKQLLFDMNDNIVVYTETRTIIIDWRNNAIIYEFDISKYSEDNESIPPQWDVVIGGKFALYSAGDGYERILVNTEKMAHLVITIDEDIPFFSDNHVLGNSGELAVYSKDFWDDSGRIIIVTSDSTIILDDDFIRNDFNGNMVWSDDGSLLVVINNQNEAVIYDMKMAEAVKIIPLLSPVGIAFTPDNNYLLALGSNGILYEHSLISANQVRQLKVYDSASAPIGSDSLGVGMFAFLSWDGRDNLILTAGNFDSSYVIDMEEFAFRVAIPELGAYSEKNMLFAQYGSGVKIRCFYSVNDLINMAKRVLSTE